ncbi:MAG: BrnT family toxin [Janthinobacterium lividum]
MRVTFDPAKRDATLAERGLDFADAVEVFGGSTVTIEDCRFAYPEVRFQTFGWLDGRMVNLVWTPTSDGRRIISMRKANDREKSRYAEQLG